MNRSLAFLLIFLAAAAGFFARAVLYATPSEVEVAEDDHHDEHDEEEPHVPLTKQAFDTLGLRMEAVAIADYQQTTSLPAEVVEFPGVSAYKLAASVNGVVTAVAAEPGVSVAPGDALFEIQITDERVLDAQLKLLEALTRRQIVEEEFSRLQPLAASGAVSGRQRRDLDYERRELETKINLRREELLVRGLLEEQVERLVETKRLLKTVVVRVPARSGNVAPGLTGGADQAVRTVAWEEQAVPDDFSVERLLVEPGQTVQRGEALCDLASHSRLYLRVMAFERDVPLLAELADEGEELTAEFGHSLETHGASSSTVDGLRIRYVANHVDPVTKSYECYLPLENELLHETTSDAGRRYLTWRFSVGQRAHLQLPIERITGQIPLPVEAVAIEGPNAFVFRPHEEEEHEEDEHHDDEHDEEEHAHEEAFIELEPAPVTVLYRDNRTVVVAAGDELHEGDVIAMNGAYQLHLAVTADAGGGHDHHHHH